jgi:hypothetical protein
MGELQKLRVAVVILLSQENSRLLSRRQRVAGKEIEVMCAERDLELKGATPDLQARLDALYLQDGAARASLRETEQEIERMQELMARIDADIAALCQA